ncbi:Ntn hydrolase family protein [Halorussus halophilus]|uniref:proteasome subunit beta n=1 Tax=Halorussus halophilus TaxID=2650975 RepID=UPI001301663D|nr:proteasome subunit beta [Halorussus halophilus]
MPDPTNSPNFGTDSPNAGADVLKTGTTTVALTAADGVVLAADQRASLGGRLVSSKDMQKVEQVHPTAALTLSGAVGELQEYVRQLRSKVDLYKTRRGNPPSMHATATFAGNLLRHGPYRAAQLTLGGVDSDGQQVYSFDAGGGVTESPYAAGGSGMQLAYGVLEREFDAEMTIEEARVVAARAIESASERDTASGNGLTLAEVTADGVELDSYEDPASVAGDDSIGEVA